MQDIKEAEGESIRDLTNFLDAELDYHERCAEELRRTRQEWAAGRGQTNGGSRSERSLSRRPTRSRSNTAHSFSERNDRTEHWATRQGVYEEDEPTPEPVRAPIRSGRYGGSGAATPEPARPTIGRSSTYGVGSDPSCGRQSSYREPPPPPPESLQRAKTTLPPPSNVGNLRNNLRPVNRVSTNGSSSQDVFGDGYDTNASSGSPDYERSESPATSYGSLSRTTSNNGLTAMTNGRKAPPPPPSRAKKPPPPIPAKRDLTY